jgi:hypothetical protein
VRREKVQVSSWRQRFQERIRYRLIDLDTADGEAVNAPSMNDVFA